MTDETAKLLINGAPGTIAAIASLVAAVRINAVHRLVNSQYSNLLQRNLEALEKIAGLSPTEHNIMKADAAKQVVEDHKLP